MARTKTKWLEFSFPQIATITVAVLGSAASLGGAYLSYTQGNRELDIKLIEIGIGILRSDPKQTDVKAARAWAVEIIEKSSGTKFSAADRAELIQRPLGFSRFANDPNLFESATDFIRRMEKLSPIKPDVPK